MAVARIPPNPPRERQLLAIPLPHGRTGSTGLLTVYFSPRLLQGGPLWHYAEWEHWPDTVNTQLSIDVIVNGASRPFTRVTPLAEPAAWQAVFADDTPVSGYRPTDWRRLAQDGLQVGPGGDFSEAILRLYAAFATRYPTAPPPGDEAITLPEASVLSDPALDDARAYVKPMEDEDRQRIAEPRDPEWDFHEFVSLLGHHP
ncbi:MAG TPA: hypothetical protein VFO97_05320, partial [Desertimonas sp.]|nr:hypothetical protein [Desertimonas sp.]